MNKIEKVELCLTKENPYMLSITETLLNFEISNNEIMFIVYKLFR
jgi:hypothetical protein